MFQRDAEAPYARLALPWIGFPLLCRFLAHLETAAGVFTMTDLHLIAGLLTGGLLVYLFIALWNPEIFS
jgi:hypothetical protein